MAWYNGHPDHRNDRFDLSGSRVAVVGVGNVAMDVTRILVKDPEDLASTDIAHYALDALRKSRIKEVVVLGRRGPVQAKFTPKEIQEIGSLRDVDVMVRTRDLELDEYSLQAMRTDKPARRNVQYMMERARLGSQGGSRRVRLQFLASPVEILSTDGRVSAVRVERNRLVADEQGWIRSVGTGVSEIVPVDLVFRSVGYRGVPLPGIPFDERKGVIPSAQGRVLNRRGEANGTGEYVVGWIKRGPTGLIGTNKGDSAETVRCMMEDIRGREARPASEGSDEAVSRLLLDRGIRPIRFSDWNIIDREEQERGRRRGKLREKITDPAEVASLLDGRRRRAAVG